MRRAAFGLLLFALLANITRAQTVYPSAGVVVAGQVLALNSSGQVYPIAASATYGAIGVASNSVSNAGQPVTVTTTGGDVSIVMDDACTAGQAINVSTTTAGEGHCNNSVGTSSQYLGIAAVSGPTSIVQSIFAPSLSSAGGGGSGCIPSGSSGQVLLDSGSGACNDSSLATDNGTTFTVVALHATSAVLVTPNLGTPSALNMTNATALPSSVANTAIQSLSGCGTATFVYTPQGSDCVAPGGMVYPGAGVANSTGSAWGTSYGVGTGANDLLQLTSGGLIPSGLLAVPGAIGATTPNTGNFTSVTASAGLSSTSDGVHAGIMSVYGNTAAPTIPTNSFGFIGPNSATFTSYVFQCPATAPSAASLIEVAAVSSNVSACTFPTTLPTSMVPAFTGDASNSAGSLSLTVSKINNTSLAGLATGILYNTTSTGVPSIATAAQILSACTGCAPLASPVFTGSITTPQVLTSTNCSAAGTAASPSVASCSAASAGQFSCATNASTATCTVDTSAVATTSEVFVQPDASATISGVTCNTTADTGLTAPRLASRSSGTSFTINLGTFSSNPLCFDYFVVNP